jgi:acetyl esterase/lipase
MNPGQFASLFVLFSLSAVVAADENNKAVLRGGNFEVTTIKDIAYDDSKDADPVRHKLDLYLPKGHKDFPVLMFVHGGAWSSGTKNLYGALGHRFAQNGIGTVIINYRLSPAVKHPAHAEDVAKAFAWTHKNIAKHGGHTDQIFLSGHSAGGHLVALLATDETYLKAHKLAISDIKGVMPLSGVYTILPSKLTERAFSNDVAACKDASPLSHVNGKHPPCLVIYADKDYAGLPAMAQAFNKKLKGSGCVCDVLEIADRTHISIIIGVAKQEDPTTQAMLGFIARHANLKLEPVGK